MGWDHGLLWDGVGMRANSETEAVRQYTFCKNNLLICIANITLNSSCVVLLLKLKSYHFTQLKSSNSTVKHNQLNSVS